MTKITPHGGRWSYSCFGIFLQVPRDFPLVLYMSASNLRFPFQLKGSLSSVSSNHIIP